MKRLFAASFFALALLAGAIGMTPVAHADPAGTANGSACDVVPGSGKADGVMQNGACVAPTSYTSQSSAAAQTPVAYKPDSSDSAYNGVMIKIMSLFAWLVGVAALTLDYAVYYTVVSMGTFVSKLSAIGVTWRILRDIGNIALIFGFLAIGITTILNVNWYGGGKKMLPMLLVAAVFLNFSLFFSEAIIDVGNLFATQFYTQINGGVPPTALSLSTISVANEGISNKLMSQLGLQSIYGNGTVNTQIFEAANPWTIGFMGILLFIVTAFVMFSLAFILIARFVALIFLIILAPVGFAGLAVPQLAKRAGQWWSTLFQQTITAPILLLMLYIALAVITDAQFLTGFGNGSAGAATGFVANANLPGFASFILSFIVAMGLLLAVTMQAKNLSAFGAKWATQSAGKLTFGLTAAGMRSTAGWGGNKLAKYARSTRLARVPLLGTGIIKGLDKVATGSFDVRGATIGGGLKGIVDAGAAQKGGYRADLKARTESRTKYASELTGRALSEEESINQKMAQEAIKATEKRLAEAQVRRRAAVVAGNNTQDVDDEIAAEKRLLEGHQTNLNEIESVTDKGAQRKYASNLEMGYLGLNDKSTFNKFFNFAANTDAAKAIRKEAKKSADDQTLDALKKALKKAGGEDVPAASTTPTATVPSGH